MLPANTSIAFYTDSILLGLSQTHQNISVGGSEYAEIELFLPDNLSDIFTIKAVVDDDGTGSGLVEELREDNNTHSQNVAFNSIPPINSLPNLFECDQGFRKAIFDLSVQDDLISRENNGIINYFTSLQDALNNENAINNSSQFINNSDPQTIFVRLENEVCFTTTSFLLITEKCKPFIPEGFSPNGDGINDVFEISNLLNIFENFELEVYSRNGNLIHTSSNKDGFWDGIATEGIGFKNKLVPVGTYYYVLNLKTPKFPEAFIGWVYINY